MNLVNCKFSTLVLIILLITFSLNVFATGVCKINGEDDIFENEIAAQEKANSQVENATNDNIYPKTNSEYSDVANDNVKTLEVNSNADITEVTGEAMDETEAVVTAAVEGATETLGEVLGPVGIAATIGITIGQIASVFSNPDSTDLDKATACLSWVPLVGMILSIVDSVEDGEKKEKAFLDKIKKLNDKTINYQFSAADERDQRKILENVRVKLEKITNISIASVAKAVVGVNKKLSKKFKSEYLHNIATLKTYTRQLFAERWIAVSPVFLELINFIDQSNKAGSIAGIVIQDNQWHHLTDTGRTDSTSVLSLGKLMSGTEAVLNNMSAIKSIKLDNTWLMGGVIDSDVHLKKVARYLVIALRDTPYQDKGVEYKAYSIFSANNYETLVKELATTKNFESAGWNRGDFDYIATDLSMSRAINTSIPSIITKQTIQLCGINTQVGNFLMGKTTTKITQCLNSVFRDYKNHFATYNLDDTIQINTVTNAIVPFGNFLLTYGQTHNHLLAQTKIQFINKFYASKKNIKATSCQFYSDNAKKFLDKVDALMYKIAYKDFRATHNINKQGESKSSDCWTCKKWIHHKNGHYEYGCTNTYRLRSCPLVHYIPKKDTTLQLAMNRIHQQVEVEEQNCIARKDKAPFVFAKKLTALGSFYLDKSDSRMLFEEVFEGIRSVLIKRFIKDAKLSKLSKIQKYTITMP